jgi:hypothetical protein
MMASDGLDAEQSRAEERSDGSTGHGAETLVNPVVKMEVLAARVATWQVRMVTTMKNITIRPPASAPALPLILAVLSTIIPGTLARIHHTDCTIWTRVHFVSRY